MSDKVLITWGAKEITNPVLRALTLALVIPLVVLCFVAALAVIIVSIPFLLACLVISLPFHFILRMTGRRGFIERDGDTMSYNVSPSGFQSASQQPQRNDHQC